MSQTKILTRQEIPVSSTWDLTPLYASPEEWEKDWQKIDEYAQKFASFKGRLAESAKCVREALEASDELSRLSHKLYCYAHLRADEDTSDGERQAPQDRMSVKFAEISSLTAWFDPELFALSDETLDQYLKDPELSFYKRTLEQTLRFRPHTLSEKEETILGEASDLLGHSHQTFNAISNADLKFPTIKDEDGQDVELTKGNYTRFMESSNRAVRESAFKALYSTYGGVKNTLASTLAGTVKYHLLNAKVRHFNSAREAALFPDQISSEIYDRLIQTIHERLPSFHRYFELRRKVFNLEKLASWDLGAPLVANANPDVSWEQACEWVQNAVKPLGSSYGNDMQRAFKERWIDPIECRGKRSGAYSSGCYDSPPYVLMNYNNTLDAAFTLAHELGHSMHSFYSKQKQAYHYSGYTIFVAEVASTTNEMFLFKYLLDTIEDRSFRINLLNHLVDTIRGTIFRQTQFAEFERDFHAMAEKGISLTPDTLSKHYFQMVKDYHGASIDYSPEIALEWARVPHFHYNFYVYKYATGLSAAIAIQQNILKDPSVYLPKYLNFLSAGSTKDPIDLLKDTGVDLTKSDPINAALDLFEQTVAQLEKELLQ